MSSPEDSPKPTRWRGYTRLAHFMSWNTDAAIFPCFRTLNLYNLLGLQAEIWQLQEELDGFIKANDSQEIGLEKNLYSVDWQLLQEKEENEKKGQLSTIVKLRGKLWEYNTALLHQRDLFQQPSPKLEDLEFLNRYLSSSHGDKGELVGPGAPGNKDYPGWKVHNLDDMLSLKPGLGARERFTQWFTKALDAISPHLKHREFPPRFGAIVPNDLQVYMSNEKIIAIGDGIATVLAALLTVVPIIALYFANSHGLRIGLIALFTFVFASALTIMSDVKRSEVFGASAAFVAVQVVFIGSVGFHGSS